MIKDTLDFYAFYKPQIKDDYEKFFYKALNRLSITATVFKTQVFSSISDVNMYKASEAFYIELEQSQVQYLINCLIKGRLK